MGAGVQVKHRRVPLLLVASMDTVTRRATYPRTRQQRQRLRSEVVAEGSCHVAEVLFRPRTAEDRMGEEEVEARLHQFPLEHSRQFSFVLVSYVIFSRACM